VLGANTTAVQMAAPVRKILDPPTYLRIFIAIVNHLNDEDLLTWHFDMLQQVVAYQLQTLGQLNASLEA